MLQLVASEIIVLSVVRKTSNNKLDMKWKFNRELIVVEDNGGDEAFNGRDKMQRIEPLGSGG